jgi:hypothetical protein
MTDLDLLKQRAELSEELRSALQSGGVEPSAAELGLLTSKVAAALAVPLALPAAAEVSASSASKVLGLASAQTTLPLWKLGVWVLGGVALGVGLSAAVTGLSATDSPTPRALAPRGTSAPSLDSARPALAHSVEPPSLPSAAPFAAPSPRPAPSSTVAADELMLPKESELSLLHRAQQSLRLDPARALQLATQHELEFPGGALAQERDVIEVDALIRLRRLPEAEARAERFVSKYPGSAHAVRVARLLRDARSRVEAR